MKHTLTILCSMLFLGGTLLAQSLPTLSDVFNDQLVAMQSDDANRVKNAQQDWQNICFQAGAPGYDGMKAEAVKLMASALREQELKDSAKFWLIRQLGRLDNGDNAALIGSFVANRERIIRDEAIGALAHIPNERAGKVLEELLAAENDAEQKIALQNALNFRAQQKAVDLPKLDDILKALETGDLAATDRLLPTLPWLVDVKISDLPNYTVRFNSLTPQVQVLLMDALAACRDRSAAPLAGGMTLSDNEQVRLAGFRALGFFGNANVIPGGGTSVNVLLQSIREPGEIGDTVRDSLARLNFDGADSQLVRVYQSSNDNAVKYDLTRVFIRRAGTQLVRVYQSSNDNAVKYDLTRVFIRRAGTIAVPAVETGLKSDDENLRRISIQYFENIGQQASIPALAEQYLVEPNNDIRGAIDRAIVRIETRYSDADGRGKAFIEAIEKRNEAEQVRLLPILGNISGTAAREFVMNKYTTGSPAIRAAAFQSLCNWTDISVAEELFKVASLPDDPRAANASRSYIRIITLRDEGRNAQDRLAFLEKAMSVARTDENKNFLLSRLGDSRSIEAFRFAVAYIDDAALDQAVCRAIVDMVNDTGFHMRHREEIEPFLDKVIEKSRDNGHVDRARRYKERR